MNRIKEIEITNILGTKHCSFAPGTLTVISGRNGEGKSSILETLKQLFAGGHDANLLRRGAKLGEAKIALDDGTLIRMRVSSRGTTYEITDAAGNEVKAPRTFIEELGDSLSVDPARLLLAKPKDLAGILLEVMPLSFSREELQEAVGEETWAVNQDMNLDQVTELRRQIYETRTTANRQAKEAQATAKSLRGSLDQESEGTDWAVRVKELRDLLAEAKQSREADIKTIEREMRERIDAIKAQAQRDIEAAQKEAAAKRGDKDAEYEPDLLKIQEALATAEERQRNKDRAEGIRLSLAQFEKTAKDAEREADNFSRAIEALDELKQQKLANLPIPGLEVRDGQTYADGIPFERVNLAERTKLAFQICALRAGKLPFLILDEAENFDSATWEAFKEGAKESGFQVLAARVSDGPLNIETEVAETVSA